METENNLLEILDSQLQVIINLYELENDLYDDLQQEKIMNISQAMKIISKIQKILYKEI